MRISSGFSASGKVIAREIVYHLGRTVETESWGEKILEDYYHMSDDACVLTVKQMCFSQG